MKQDRPTDEEILAMENVPVETASRYLGVSATSLRSALRECRVPFGYAAHGNPDNPVKWVFAIMPEPLVEFRHHGSAPIPWESIKALVNGAVKNAMKA